MKKKVLLYSFCFDLICIWGQFQSISPWGHIHGGAYFRNLKVNVINSLRIKKPFRENLDKFCFFCVLKIHAFLAYFDHEKTWFFLDKCSGLNPFITDSTSLRKKIICHIHFKEKKSGHWSIISDLFKKKKKKEYSVKQWQIIGVLYNFHT